MVAHGQKLEKTMAGLSMEIYVHFIDHLCEDAGGRVRWRLFFGESCNGFCESCNGFCGGGGGGGYPKSGGGMRGF